MSDIQTIHREALELAKSANEQLYYGNKGEYLRLTIAAFELEKRAADVLFSNREAEPTRSVLYRSAATLGYNCGKYSEARYLIFCALSGNPFAELKQELEELLSNIDAKIALDYSASDAVEFNYLNVLRQKAVYLKIEPKTLRYSKAIATDYIIDFLKTVNSSYANYSRVNLRRFMNPTEDEDDVSIKITQSFLKESKPLCVDLKFESFGVSIVADNEISFQSATFSAEFKEWKSKLFENYKNEVILPDYNSQEFLESIKQKYTEEERNIIYSPMLDSMKEATPYKLHLTDHRFKKILKTYSPPSVRTREVLQVKPKKNEEPIQKILQRSFDIVPATGKGKKKNIQTETMTNAEFQIPFQNFTNKEKTIDLNDTYVVKLVYNQGEFTIDDENLNIYAASDDYEKTIEQYSSNLIEIYSRLLTLKEPSVEEADQLRKFQDIVSLIDW